MKRHNTFRYFCLLNFIGCAALSAGTLEFTSPNKVITARLHFDEGDRLTWALQRQGVTLVEPSPLGITVQGKDLGLGAIPGEPTTKLIREDYAWRGVKNRATNHCAAVRLPVTHRASNTQWVLEMRLFDDGFAYRYQVPGAGQRPVNGEASAWMLPADSMAWYQIYTTHYEGAYQGKQVEDIPQQITEKNKQRPVFLGPPVGVALASGGYLLLTEANLFGYSGLTLRPTGTRLLQGVFEDDPNGFTIEGTIVTPWRVTVAVPDLHALVNTDVINNLCESLNPILFPRGLRTEWIKSGRALNTWSVFGNDGAQWSRQKWFVDQCAALSCEYLLVDGGWLSECWGFLANGGDAWPRLRELCDAALPFTRMVAGHSDFLPTYVRQKYLKNTTAVFQMATAVIATTSFICWPDHPEDYLRSPFLPLIRAIPVDWDETRVLPGSDLGRLVAFARRAGEAWYIAVLNGENQTKTWSVTCDFLGQPAYEAEFYQDNAPHPEGIEVISKQALRPDARIQVELAPGGGFVAWIRPRKV